ncbi:MAG: hypothetical protein AAGD34_14265 [Pseudomonadota bacterium]
MAQTGAGLVVVNGRGGERQSIMEGNPARWAASNGSVTFNQFGPGMPAAGMNEHGLFVSLMWNEDVRYEEAADGPVVNELEFIQRLLDTSATVGDALASIDHVAIKGHVPIHYFVSDAAGKTASLTPSPRGVVVRTGAEMPVPAKTNTTYGDLIDHLARLDGDGGRAPTADAGERSSLDRFVVAAEAARNTADRAVISDAFNVLAKVETPETRWQIVFDPTARTIRFQTVTAEGPRLIDLTALDFACRPARLALTIDHAPGQALAPLSKDDHTAMLADILPVFFHATGLGLDVAEGMADAQRASTICP